MQIDIELTNQNGYSWKTIDQITYKGYVIDDSFEHVSKEIGNVSDERLIIQLLGSLNGCFAVVVRKETFILAFVDHVRSIPLFYEKKDDRISILDSLPIENRKTDLINDFVLKQFQHSLYTFSNYTLLQSVFQIPAGSYLRIDKKGTETLQTYWTYNYRKEQTVDIEQAVKSLKETYDHVFRSYADFLKDKTIIIPLSGGHDSRLILNYFVKYGCKKIITYSYGSVNSEDANISQKVSEIYNVPHYFITYNSKSKGIYDSIIKEYLSYAANWCSVPVIQELIAVYQLKNKGMLPVNSFFVPGFGGVITGHYVKEEYLSEGEILGSTLTDLITMNFFRGYNQTPDSKVLKDWLNATFHYSESEYIDNLRANEIFEKYVFLEEQPKFIENAVRTYEFLGFPWMTPIMDHRILDIWKTISNNIRFGDFAFKRFEQSIYQREELIIPFTGSKEMKHFYKESGQKLLPIMKARFKRYLAPRSTHYLMHFVDLKTYYEGLIKYRDAEINSFVRKDLIELLIH